MNLFTTLIQGPLSASSPCLEKISTYREYGDVIISCYNSDVEAEDFPHKKISGIPICTMDLPKIPPCNTVWLDGSTFYYALSTMYNGIQAVKTPYIIKTRTDEYWGTLDPFIKEFSKNDENLVCGNIFCRVWSDFPFHFGDHIFVIKTAYLKVALESLLSDFRLGKDYSAFVPEGCLAVNLLSAMGVEPFKLTLEGYLNRVKIVDINSVGDFCASWRHSNQNYINFFINPHGVYTNEDMLKGSRPLPNDVSFAFPQHEIED
tara:strand:+ start:3953 stop:4735 length:783 start_codon:yes stop_codon:yes gene_type:complete